jgi:uracil-DNA glycosylase
MPESTPEATLLEHQARCRACTRCVDDGTLPDANPTFEGRFGARILLVGQAPGPAERETRRPFSGRAGRELVRWAIRAGFASEEDFRDRVYICSIIRCFPGRTDDDRGDRRPPRQAILNCAPWLEAELEILRPAAIIAVGQMAIERFLGAGRLEDRVGKQFGSNPVLLPLPHPSGQSRWLNLRENRARLDQALALLSELRITCATASC